MPKPPKLIDIIAYLDAYLDISAWEDYGLNGLQVEASENISKIVASVDSGLSVLEAASSKKANLLVCHHGLIWGGMLAIRGSYLKKVQHLLTHSCSLYGVHLPLDAHHECGNNILLAKEILELDNIEPAISLNGKHVGFVGDNSKKKPLTELQHSLENLEGALSNTLCLDSGPKIPERVCVVSGAAADSLYQHKEFHFDTLVTGEPRQFAYHYCKEEKLNAIFAGHYATETLGVKKLVEKVASHFDIEWEFIDEPTGI